MSSIPVTSGALAPANNPADEGEDRRSGRPRKSLEEMSPWTRYCRGDHTPEVNAARLILTKRYRLRAARNGGLTRVPSGPTVQRIRELTGKGWALQKISLECGFGRCSVGQLMRRRPAMVNLDTAAAVERLWWDVCGFDRRRFPAGPFLKALEVSGVTKVHVIRETGINVHRGVRTGSFASDAVDRLAAAIGMHPAEIWVDYYEVAA